MPTQSEVELFKILSNKDIDIDTFKQTQKQFHINYKKDSPNQEKQHTTIEGTPPPNPAKFHNTESQQPQLQPERTPFQHSNQNTFHHQNNNTSDEDDSTKQALLYELETLKNLHPELFEKSRDFNRHDSTKSLIYEIERVRSILDVNSTLILEPVCLLVRLASKRLSLD